MTKPIHVCCGGLVLPAILSLILPGIAAAQLRAELVAQGFSRPLAIVPDPTAANILFIVEQQGTVRAVVDGVTQAIPFLDVTAEVKYENEQGLLGLAFAADGQRVFVSWVKRRTPDAGIGDVVVSRFRRSVNPLVVDPASRFDLVWPGGLSVIQQLADVHKGGNLQFGPDGHLYIGLGDGGGGSGRSERRRASRHLLRAGTGRHRVWHDPAVERSRRHRVLAGPHFRHAGPSLSWLCAIKHDCGDAQPTMNGRPAAEDKGRLRDEDGQAREDRRVKVDDGRERGRAGHDFRYVWERSTSQWLLNPRPRPRLLTSTSQP